MGGWEGEGEGSWTGAEENLPRVDTSRDPRAAAAAAVEDPAGFTRINLLIAPRACSR